MMTETKNEQLMDIVEVSVKSKRVVSMAEPTPQQLAEVELSKTRNAIDSFYMDSFTSQEDLVSETEEEQQQNQDSIKPIKRENPQVGRAAKPKRQSDKKEPQQE